MDHLPGFPTWKHLASIHNDRVAHQGDILWAAQHGVSTHLVHLFFKTRGSKTEKKREHPLRLEIAGKLQSAAETNSTKKVTFIANFGIETWPFTLWYFRASPSFRWWDTTSFLDKFTKTVVNSYRLHPNVGMWKRFYQESNSNDVALISFLDNMYIDILHHFCPGCFYGFCVPFAQGLVTRSSLNVIRLRVVSRYKTTSGLISISKAIPGKPPEAPSRIYLNQLLRGWQVKWWIIH